MRMVVFGTVAAAVAAFAAYDKYDKNTNYQPVDARVSAVSEQCYMEKVERGVLTKTTSTSALLGCKIAELLVQEHPKWRGYAINHKIEIKFSYVSPVDGATHNSKFEMSAYPSGQPMHAGDVYRVLVSKTKADKTREL